jgi:hypothetical protein
LDADRLPRSVLQEDLKKFKYWDKVVPIFTKGVSDGRQVSDQGTPP